MRRFDDCKVRVNNPTESRLVQEKLFSLGYKWLCNEKEVVHTEAKYLFIGNDGYLTYDYSNDCFIKEENKEVTVQEILRYKEEKMDKEEALKKIEELKKYVEDIDNEQRSYPCVTPVDEVGDILFNNNKQVLYVNDNEGVYGVTGGSHSDDYKKDFVWVPCKREDLKVGDTAYRTNDIDYGFSDEGLVCKILDEERYVYISDNEDIIVLPYDYKYWFKLVHKNEVER